METDGNGWKQELEHWNERQGGAFMSIAKRYNQKALYFSDKLKEGLDNIFDYPLTIVEAPMGYGKTTAVREHLKSTGAHVLWQRVNDSSTNSYWHGFSRLFGKVDDDCSQSLVQLGFPNDSVSRQEALKLIKDIELPPQTVLVIDDYHLIDSSDVNNFIEFLVRNEIDNLHIVITARFMELQNLEELMLKGYLHHIAKETFELSPKEIIKYYRLCGISLKDTEADKLYSFTEGWISALYLFMLDYIKEGNFKTIINISKLVEKAVYTPFSEEIKDFLLTLCIFDYFTLEQAFHMWQKDNAGKLLTEITNKNAFIKYDKRTKTYQIHNIFTNFLNDVLESKHVKNELYRRAADWFLKTGDYTEAMHYFYSCKDFDNLLLALEEEKSKSINVEYNKEILIKYFEECPAEVKAKHHFALLIFAIRLFFLNEIVLFDKACGEFIRNLQMDESLNDGLRKRFLGEYELLMGFTKYNDITKMSEQHQKAGNLLSETSSLIYTNGSWTFGSPSVLYMFYRETGKLERQVKDLIGALPYYYKLTDGNGNGAEYVMEAERYFNLGDRENAEITVNKALHKAQSNTQIGIITCAIFLQIRLNLIKGDYSSIVDLFQKMREDITRRREYLFIHTVDICEGYIYSLLKQTDKIPEWIARGDFNSRRLQFPVLAMLNIVYGRVLLIKGDYLKLIGSSEHFIGIASVFPNLLGQIHTYIYLAAANQQIFRANEALEALKQALEIAMPDRVYMPFVENCDYIKPLLEQLYREWMYREDITRILELSTTNQRAVKQITKEYFSGENPQLTEREMEIAHLAADGLTNKEIGERLYISPNTVKTQLKSIFEKMGVNSRALLKQHMETQK